MSKYLELVQDSFTQEHFDKQAIENKPYVAYSIKDKEVIYTIIPKEDGTMYTIYRVVSKDISNCTYNMVDLGLSVKWADRNVGATSPEHYGSYFQWGDTNAYTFDGAGEITAAELADLLNPILSPQLGMEITAGNVGMVLEQMGITDTDLTPMGISGVLGKFFNWDSYFDTTDDGSTFKKYNNNGGLTVLESSDDSVTVHMGSNYRMPTRDEIYELIDNTTRTFIDLDGNEFRQEQAENGSIEQEKLKGVKFTGSNGNSIFIPAAGFCDESLLSGIGMYGLLWSSSLNDGYDDYARGLYFNYDGDVDESGNLRYYGQSVRGVQA
jgi:hypothetical protein